MMKLCPFFALLVSLALAKTPPEGTAFTLSYAGSGGVIGHMSYEEQTTCLRQVASFGQAVTLKAAVPVYPSQRAGLTRVFALGKTLHNVSELWLVDPSPSKTQKFSYTDVVSLAPYSQQEVLVGQKDGDLFVVDGDGMELHKYRLADHFPQGFTAIGDLVYAWRSGIKSISALTQNFYLNFNDQRTVIIQMNPTTPTVPGAYIPSFDLGTIFTGIGDDQYVWIVHDWTDPSSTPSFSLLHLGSGNHLQRHVTPGTLRGFGGVSPIYFESASQTGYFAMGPNFMSADPTRVFFENPAGQLTASGLGINSPGAPLSLVFAPPVQGTPWATQYPAWLTPKWGQRGTGGTSQLASRALHTNPGVVNSVLTPASTSPVTATPPNPDEKKVVFGVERTRADFTDYVKRQLGKAIDGSDQVSSKSVAGVVKHVDKDLRMALNGLDNDTLRSLGLKYDFSAGLQMDGPDQTTPLADWIEALWKSFK